MAPAEMLVLPLSPGCSLPETAKGIESWGYRLALPRTVLKSLDRNVEARRHYTSSYSLARLTIPF